MATLKPPPSSPGSAIPDLDVYTPTGRQSGSRTAPKPPRGTGLDLGGTHLLDDGLWGTGSAGSLELAEEVRNSLGSRQGMADDASEAWPTGVTPAAGSLEIDPAKVDKLCTWGPTPEAIWQTVPYAIAVTLGRRGLLGEARAAANELSRAEKRRDERLAALGEQLLDTVSVEPRLRAAAETAKAAIAELAEVNKQQRQAFASVDSQVSAYEQALTNEQHQLQALNSQLQHCRSDVEQAELSLKREQARLQRLNIERRNLEHAEAKNPELPAKLESLAGQARSVAPRIESAERALSASRSALQHIQASADASESHVRELQRLEQIQTREQSVQLRTASIQSQNAEVKKRTTLADVGRAVLASAGRIAVESSMLAELRKRDEEVAGLSLRQQILVQALDNYDRPSTKRGLLLIVVAVGLFVLGLLIGSGPAEGNRPGRTLQVAEPSQNGGGSK